jgi:PadR family transcriptional regulator AphA
MVNTTRTTLSHAVLGLLSLRPMTAYELVQGYERSLGQIMSRSEAAIYAEPRRLEAAGLVAHQDQVRGRRVVAVYDITEAGRAALQDWLAHPEGFPMVDAEPVLRVAFADPSDPAPLRAIVSAFREATLARLAVSRAVVEEYRRGSGPYQHRATVVAMSGSFVVELFATYLRWCDRMLAGLDGWTDDGASAAWAAGTIDEMARLIADLGVGSGSGSAGHSSPDRPGFQ